MSKPLQLSGVPEVTIGGSIGIAIYPDDADDGDNLITRADMAKRTRPSRWGGFAGSASPQHAAAKPASQADPQAVPGQGRRSGSSACAISPRWMWRKVGSSVSRPWYAGTIPCSAMCRRRSSFRWPKRWGSSGKSEAGCFPPHWPRWGVAATGRGEVPVSVNLSGFQLSASLPELVAQLLEAFSVEAALLTLELTETVLMLDMKGCIEILDALSEQGSRSPSTTSGRATRPGLPQPVAHRHHQAGPLLRGGAQPAGDPGDGGHGHQSGARDPGGRGGGGARARGPCRPRGCHVFQGFLFSRPMTPGRGGGGGVRSTVPAGPLSPRKPLRKLSINVRHLPFYEVRDAKLNIINRIFVSYHGIH